MWVDKNEIKDGRDNDAMQAAKRVLVVDLQSQNQSEIAVFNQQITDQFGKAPFYCNGTCLGNQSEWNVWEKHSKMQLFV
jgi:hypothetical protein